ncbi:MAG TPA: S41 family peptidase [Planctomycetota bacterium]|nr:S41 family peptidase [Planctomycetota bacterium]HUV40045.1 S41 family peptidase [Planctomycetota bacterium]
MRRRDVIWTLVIVIAATWVVQGFAAKREDLYPQFETLAIVVEKIRDNYVEEVDEDKILEGALRGALLNLDRYSAYISPEDFEEFRTETKGEFHGLGIEIGIRQNWLTVIAPIEETPAWRAGIRAGDRIIKIEGKSTAGMSTLDAVKVLRGPKGTKVTITIRHEGERRDVDLTITRDVIPLISVRGYRRMDEAGHWDFFVDPDKKIGYIRLSAFRENTAEELDGAMDVLRRNGMKALVLDLRFNPGGLLSSAVNVSDRFLDEGVIVSTRGRAVKPVSYEAHKLGTYEHFPMAVLVNNWSASASEIVAGAVQDHGRAIVIGESTFGKGSVQNVIPLQGGKAALKLTTARYYTPSGRSIHREEGSKNGGLVPDIVVETTPDDKVKIQRLWLKLGTPPKPEDKKKEEERVIDDLKREENVEPEEIPTEEELDDKKPVEEPFRDEQLERALVALRVLLWNQNGK